ncbi:uncharacterized protein BDW43DRAFT_298802 [Aspergillus alliaceus]|uniref:uncharacterized protein n=1 Tax=Petromyces alliaceus TaxID=209559 RepID=UPI0012A40311|nr:uncharacterized protein BDW43DRAFT_298802 [Aspergillus alliaceus]KAB8235781.1 hypothetical protein BDW43DRAFT_298802 [Aspergillus alliaceus]
MTSPANNNTTYRQIRLARLSRKISQTGNEIYYGGTGPEPFLYYAKQGNTNEFGGAAFAVETQEDLEYASQTLPGATGIYELDRAPGGGLAVTFRDPVDGFLLHLVQYQSTNWVISGCVTNFAKALGFYTTRFNFKPRDLIHDPAGKDITTFLHLDRGEELVDHHSLFFFEGPSSHVYHSSFETHDFDYWLVSSLRCRYGCCVLDDLVNGDHAMRRSPASPDNLHAWGPDLPEGILG